MVGGAANGQISADSSVCVDKCSTRLDAVHFTIPMLKVSFGASVLIALVGACSTFDEGQGAEQINPVQSGSTTTLYIESDTTETTRAPVSVPKDLKKFVGFWMVQSVSGAEDSDLSTNIGRGYLSFRVSTGNLVVILWEGTCAVFGADVTVSDGVLKVQRENVLPLIGCTSAGPVPIVNAITECLRDGCLYEFADPTRLRLFLSGGIDAELLVHPGARIEGG